MFVNTIREIPRNGLDTAELLRVLRGTGNNVFVFEQTHPAETGTVWDRYSYLAADPLLTVSALDGAVTIRCRDERLQNSELIRRARSAGPAEALRLLADAFLMARPEAPGPVFPGGFAGYFSYEYGDCVRGTIRWACENREGFLSYDLILADRVYILDRERDQLLLSVCAEEGTAPEALKAVLDQMEGHIRGNAPLPEPLSIRGAFAPMFSKERHMDMVREAQKKIEEHAVEQVIISNALEAEAEGTLAEAFLIMRESDPTNYMCYFASEDMEAAVPSPETILRVRNRETFCERLAGTSPRGGTPEEDEALGKALLADRKSMEEHMMLVEDTKEEVSAYCDPETVEVSGLMHLVRCARVMHIGSNVTGTLKKGMDALDAIGIISPAGVVGGKPKDPAAEVISAIEKNRRGPYGGAMGFLSLTGDAAFCAFIHAAYLRQGRVSVRAGGGIIAGSVPEDEYQEAMDKAGMMVEILKTAGT